MAESHAITRSLTPHPPGSFLPSERLHEQELDEHTRAQNVRFLIPTEIVWLMGLGGFILSILAIVTPLRCYIQPCFPNRTVPMTPSYYFARSRPFSPQRPASSRRSVSTLSSQSSSSTASSTLLETPNLESLPQSILITPHPSPSNGRGAFLSTKRVSFKEDLIHQELSPTLRVDQSVPPVAPVDVWALAVMDDLLVLEESHTKEFSKANAQKRKCLKKNLPFSTRCPITNLNISPKLSPTPSFSSTMSDMSSNSLDPISKEPQVRGRQIFKKKLFRKHNN